MKGFIITTDSSCDLPLETLQNDDVRVVPLSFTLDDAEYEDYPDERQMSRKRFYELVCNGAEAKTSAINSSRFEEFFRSLLPEGRDVIYLGMSSGISCTVNNAMIAADAVRAEYEAAGLRLVVCDTLSGGCGLGILVCIAAELRSNGANVMEAYRRMEDVKLSIAHWFIVDNLMHLVRGGRLNAGAAAIGTVLKLKPIIHCNYDGKIESVSKAPGRNMAFRKLVDRVIKDALEPEKQTIFVSGADCPEDVQTVADMLKKELNVKDVVTSAIGPVLGAHCGAGTVAVFYIGKER